MGERNDQRMSLTISAAVRLCLLGLLLILVSVVLLLATADRASSKRVDPELDRQVATMARMLSDQLNHFRATLVVADDDIAGNDCLQALPDIRTRLDESYPAFRTLRCLDIHGLDMANRPGLPTSAPAATGLSMLTPSPLLADATRDDYHWRLVTGQRIALEPPSNPSERGRVVRMLRPLTGASAAWLAGDIDLRGFDRLAAGIDPDNESLLQLMHDSGAVLARAPRLDNGGATWSVAPVPATGGREGDGWASASRSLPAYGVVAVAMRPKEPMLGWLRWLEPAALAGTGIGTVLILAALLSWRRQQGSFESAFARLAADNERLSEVHRVNELGVWEYRLNRRTITWSGDALGLLGLDESAADHNWRAALAHLHPDDRRRAIRRLLSCVRDNEPIDETIRVAVRGKPTRHLHVRARTRTAPNGSRVISGTLLDVTETQLAREKQARAEAQYRYLFERSPIPMFVLDTGDRRILAANRAMTDLYGWSIPDLTGMPAVNLFEPDEHIQGEALLDDPELQDGTIWPHRTRGGDLIYVRGYSKLVDFDGKPAHLIACVDFTEKILAQEDLIESEARFRLMSRVSNDAIYDYDIPHRNLWWSDSYRHHFGADAEHVDGELQTWVQRVHPDDRNRVLELRQEALGNRTDHWDVSYRYQRQDGGYAQVRDRGFILRDGDGQPHRMIGGMLDRSAELEAQRALIEQETTYRGLVERLPLPLLVMREGVIVFANPSATESLRLRPGQSLVGSPIQDIFDPALCALLEDHSWFGITRQVRTKRADGTDFLAEMAVSSYRDEKGEGLQAVLRDLTEQLRFEQILTHQARHDTLTGLPNRRALEDRLRAWLAVANEHGGELAVIFVDLDQFKVINDALGHGVGDSVIRTIARRLHKAIDPNTTFGRFGGDEFMILADADSAEAMIRRLRDAMNEPIEVMGTSQSMTASIGVAVGPRDGQDADTLIRSADAAMYEAKRLGRNRSVMYSSVLHRAARNRLETVSRLRESNLDQELAMHYQTKHDATTGAISGMELLLRWPKGPPALRQPGRFIPICEETGLMVPVGRWALREACRLQNAAALIAGRPCRVAVNVSAQQFMHDDLLAEVKTCLEETGASSHLLEIEITESVILVDPERVVRTIKGLRKLGVEVTIDDFGNGYSNLGYLKHLPVNKLKIDQSFVRDLMIDRQNEAICQSIISLAHSLSLRVVAEGVETRRQRDWLVEHDCDELQGFLFSQPRPFPSTFTPTIVPSH